MDTHAWICVCVCSLEKEPDMPTDIHSCPQELELEWRRIWSLVNIYTIRFIFNKENSFL